MWGKASSEPPLECFKRASIQEMEVFANNGIEVKNLLSAPDIRSKPLAIVPTKKTKKNCLKCAKRGHFAIVCTCTNVNYLEVRNDEQQEELENDNKLTKNDPQNAFAEITSTDGWKNSHWISVQLWPSQKLSK